MLLALWTASMAFCDDVVTPTPPILLPQGPNMYTFPVYGNVPVDYYTGAMHFSIHIHEIDVDGCKVPISLEYVGNGIKVSQDASNVGLGWYLNCGGGITLDCYGQDDFDYHGGYLNTKFPHGVPDDEDLYKYRKNNNPAYDITIWDTRPDVYTYSFAGYYGKMMFPRNNRHVPKLLNPKDYLNVYFEHDARQWTIYDAFGNKYCFGNMYHESGNGYSGLYTETSEGGTSLRVVDDPSAVSPDWTYRTSNAWPIDTIVTNHGHRISFTYHHEFSCTPVLSKEEIRLVPQRINPNIGFQYCNICTSSMTESYNTTELKQAVIDRITAPGETVIFYSSARNDIWEGRGGTQNHPTKLDSIIVMSGTKISKKVRFYYHYMGLTATPNTCRLILDSISGLSPRPYVFTYYTESLPKKNSRQIDMWGYYNNSLGMRAWGIHGGIPIEEGTLVPSMELGGKFYYGRNRNVNADVITNAMLKEVKYPTGGKSKFIYEPNKVAPFSTDAECIESVIDTRNISLIYGLNYSTNPAQMTLADTADILTFYLDSTDILDANIKINTIWGKALQPTIIAYLVLRNNVGNYIIREDLRLYGESIEKDVHFQLNGQHPAGTYTLTLEDAGNTAISMDPQTPYQQGDRIYVIARVTHSKHQPLGNMLEYAAGVRVASILNYDTNDSLIRQQTYTYLQSDSLSSGLLMVQPRYHRLFEAEYLGNTNPTSAPNLYCLPAHGYIVNSDMLVPQTPIVYSTPLGYSKVTETISPETQYGKTEYIFYNQLGEDIDTWPGFASVGNPLNGTLLRRNTYTAEQQLVEKECYSYENQSSFSIEGLHYFQLFPHRYYTGGNQVVDNIKLSRYSISHTRQDNIEVTKTTYDNSGDSIVEIRKTFLDTCLMLPKKQYIGVNNDSMIITHEYALRDSTQNGQTLRDFNYPGALLKSIKSENNSIQDMAFYQYNAINNHGVLTKEFHIKPGNNQDTICTYNVMVFDSNNNPTTLTNTSLIPVAYLWGCSQTLPIVQVIGITDSQLQSVFNQGFVSMLHSACDLSLPILKSVYSAISNAFPHAEITVRSYISGIGVSYEIAPHGVVTIYDYDDYGRLVSISQEINGNRRIIEQYEYHFSEE